MLVVLTILFIIIIIVAVYDYNLRNKSKSAAKVNSHVSDTNVSGHTISSTPWLTNSMPVWPPRAGKIAALQSRLSLPPNNLSPLEFEGWCADSLRAQGWDAKETKASGDQGADIIAIKYGKKVVVQCKYYSGSVGNEAVQQVFSAKAHYKADGAAVVTNSSYTVSAKRLAASTNVKLLNVNDINSFDRLIWRN